MSRAGNDLSAYPVHPGPNCEDCKGKGQYKKQIGVKWVTLPCKTCKEKA